MFAGGLFGRRPGRLREDAASAEGPLGRRSVRSLAREAMNGGQFGGRDRNRPAPPGRAERLGLRAVEQQPGNARALPFRLLAAGDQRTVSMQLTGTRDGASVSVFDLFLDCSVGARGESVGGWTTFRYHVAVADLGAPGLPWLAITDRRPPIELYDPGSRARLATGVRTLDRQRSVHSDQPDALARVFAAPAARDWLREALSESYVDHRPLSVLEISSGWALLAARTGDFGHPDEIALANPRSRFGPWPDELLLRLSALRALIAAPDSRSLPE
jgi:hypothetical protein